MATQRLVNTNFWKDTYVIDLDPIQKLLFLYFLTNPRTSLAGVYELSIREAAFDTGIDKDMVDKILAKFCADGKMHYQNGWLILRNFVKHQRMNPSISKGIEKAVAELPKWLQVIVEEFSSYYDQQRLDIPDSTQSGTRLPQTVPSVPPIEAKIIEAKIKKDKLKETKISKDSAKIPSQEIDAAFAAWNDIVGFEIKGSVANNRKACSNLLKTHGTERLMQLIRGVALSHTDKFAPRISDFVSLQSKQNALIVWGRKKGSNNAVAQF